MSHRSLRRLGLLAVLLMAIVLPGRAASAADIVTERVSYEQGGDQYFAWLVHDAEVEGARPSIMLFHEWWGLDDFALQRARALAEAGYAVFCVDMYGMTVSGENVVAETPEEAARRSGLLYRDRVWMRRIANAAFIAAARANQIDPTRMVSLGYGFGGTVAMEFARGGATVKGTICMHGGLHNPSPDDAARIRSEVLVMVGTEDPMVGDAEIDAFEAEMDGADRDYQVIRISGAEHAFSNRASDFWEIPGASYDARAAELADRHIRAFLDRMLGGVAAGQRIREEG